MTDKTLAVEADETAQILLAKYKDLRLERSEIDRKMAAIEMAFKLVGIPMQNEETKMTRRVEACRSPLTGTAGNNTKGHD